MENGRRRSDRIPLLHALLAAALTAQASQSRPASRPGSAPRERGPLRLLVVAPAAFAPALAPLIDHKNRTGMPAEVVTLEQLRGAFQGRDDQERIKRCILRAHEDRGVRYVLLAGDASRVPVRYRQVQQMAKDAPHDGTYNPSELYWSNLYHDHAPGRDPTDPGAISHKRRFDDWDHDGDGIYNEQHWNDDAVAYNPDQVDGCPDVAAARVPAHTAQELANYVAKVIRYETGGMDPGMFDRIAFVADAHYGGATTMCDSVAAVAAQFARAPSITRLLLNSDKHQFVAPWSHGDFDAVDAAASSSWWLTYIGHAGPRYWGVYEGGRGYDAGRTERLANAGALPIVFAAGCESGMFAVWQPQEPYRDRAGKRHEFVWHGDQKYWEDRAARTKLGARILIPQPDGYEPADRSDRTFACAWLLRPDGGAIAYFGESVVCENDKGRDLLLDMFERRRLGDSVLGDVWLNGQRRYWLDYRTQQNVFRHPRIYLGIMNFFGDPSLRLPGVGAR